MNIGTNKWLIVIAEVLIVENMSFAVPAWPNLSQQKQPDGTPFQMRLKGDEFYKWHETSDGYTILRDKKDGFWKYAGTTADKSGLELIPEGIVGVADPESLGLVPGILPDSEKIKEKIRKRLSEQKYTTLPKDISIPPAYVPIAGTTTIKNIVILAAFNDHWDEEDGTVLETYGHVDISNYEDLFNKFNYSKDQAVGSVRDYFKEISYGRLDIESIVFPWVHLPEDEAYYGENDLDGSDSRPQQMARDAIEAAATIGFDFSQGDSDNDDWVDCLTIIHSGHGEEWVGNPASLIWSHRWGLVSVVTKNDTNMFRYHTSPALRERSQIPVLQGLA